ncbi:hypothetical protein A5740_21735 [Mycobacterium sp. GA-1841]|uniref:hypothetical protein n=1 Tax=Mycobacterium sp. GA-1841 TaxID=1834154 RepID=UPI00096F7830|nr:hypothetical protein [Mycobacterium sp. GA-1841]OMC41725.1 hypothetical protein A5740_21735 [Mycobacterium sp. GA-1841]
MTKIVVGAAILAATAGLALAPSASADPECTDVGGATRCSNPGNVQINATPRQTGPALPYGCDPAYAALCYDGIPGIAIDIGGGDHHGGGGGGGGGRHPRR